MSRLARVLLGGFLTALVAQCVHQPPASTPAPAPGPRVDPFAGLPPLPPDDRAAFVFPAGPTPPGSTGTLAPAFPAPPRPRAAPAAAAPVLRVLFRQPAVEGRAVGVVSASFNQPMAPVASLADLKGHPSPLEITPRVPGRFRWLDPRTIVFVPRGDRMPFGTRYRAKIPAGVRSLSGATLDREVSWTFSTPRPALVSGSPDGEDSAVGSILALRFNQKIDPAGVLKRLRINGRAAARTFTLVPRQAWKPLDEVEDKWRPDRVVVLRSAAPFSIGKTYRAIIGRGLAGEGPLAAGKLTHTFSVHPAFRVLKVSATDGKHRSPGYGLTIRFTTQPAMDVKDLPRFISITPKVPGLAFEEDDTHLLLTGGFRPRTRYAVTIRRGLEDMNDQRLARDVTFTVTTGDIAPGMSAPDDAVVPLTAGDPAIPVHLAGVSALRVRMVRVTPRLLSRLSIAASADEDEEDGRPVDPLRGIKGKVITRQLRTGLGRNDRRLIQVKLAPLLGKGEPGIVFVDLRSDQLRRHDRNAPRYAALIAEVTDIGLLTSSDPDRAHVMATSLSSGAPLPGVTLELRGYKSKVLWSGQTGAAGLATIPAAGLPRGRHVLWARKGADACFTSLRFHRKRKVFSLVTMFTERNPYRPGETVHLKGVVRQIDPGAGGGVKRDPRQRPVSLTIRSPRRRTIKTAVAMLTASGTFTHDLDLAADAAIGTYRIRAVVGKDSFTHTFQVAAYRAPRFVVKIEGTGGQRLTGQRLEARVGADYLFGAPVAGVRASWTLTRALRPFEPAGNPGFHFGPHRWSRRQDQPARGRGKLDAAGRMKVSARLEPFKEHPFASHLYTLEARVMDLDRQELSDRRQIVVHPSRRHIGLSAERRVVAVGEPFEVSAVVTDRAGQRLADQPVKLQVLSVDNGDKIAGAPAARCEVTSARLPRACALRLPAAGEYLVRAEVAGKAGEAARTTLQVFAFGGAATGPVRKNLDMVSDRKSYAPGNVARILIRAPFSGGRGMLILSRGGILERRPLALKGSTAVVDVPIKAAHTPAMYVTATLVRGVGRGAARASRSITLPVRLDHHRITVAVAPDRKKIGPGETVKVKVKLRDSRGAPVKGEVTLMVVDEGVLSLLKYETPDLLPRFWSNRWPRVRISDTHSTLITPPEPPEETPDRSEPRTKRRHRVSRQPRRGRKKVYRITSGFLIQGREAPKIHVRTHFASTAHFAPEVMTDARGLATVKIKMPDSLTTFRIMAVAVDRTLGARFGSGEASVTVRKPLLLRPALPRFLSLGDRFQAAVIVHNNTDAAGAVEVLARGHRISFSPARRRVQLPARGKEEVRFDAVALRAGRSRVQFAAVLSAEGPRPVTDAVERRPPVLIPASAETFASYGVTDGAVVQPIKPPKDVLGSFGGLRLSLSSTALTGLEDSVRYLIEYPHGCTEQLASRLLPLLALQDVIGDFSLKDVPDDAARAEMIRVGIARLLKHQRRDGGWGLWASSRASSPYLTAYALFVLHRARGAGFAPPGKAMDRGVRYLRRKLRAKDDRDNPGLSRTRKVFALWVLSSVSKISAAAVKPLLAERDRLPLFARIWLMQTLHRVAPRAPQIKEMLRALEGRAVLTASGARFAEAVTETHRLLMHSSDRTDAIALGALLEVAPRHPLIPRLVRGLLAGKIRGRWSTTQANAFALLAVAAYYRTFERSTPDYRARAWLDRRFVGEARFSGRQMKTVRHEVPMRAVKRLGGATSLLLSKRGPGKLYYRIGLRYAPASFRLSPADRGFTVERRYELLDGSAPAKAADGSLEIAAGSVVRVRLKITATARRHYVAVVDPLPAGFEPVDTGLATTSGALAGSRRRPRSPSWSPRRRRAWSAFDHTEQRDESIRLYADRLVAGVYRHSYLARATSRGTFIAAPTRAEEMYSPETFGRGATATVQIR